MTDAAAAAAPATQTTAPAVADVSAQPAASTPAAQPNAAPTAPAADPFASLKAPEGFDVAAMPKLVEVAKTYGLNAESAQKLLNDTHARQVQAKADMDAAMAKQKADWHETIKADKDYGGDKFAASLQRAQKVVGEIDSKIAPGIKQLLDDSGYGEHPAVVRLFNYLGAENREDTFAGGENNATSPADLGTRLFGSTPFKGAVSAS